MKKTDYPKVIKKSLENPSLWKETAELLFKWEQREGASWATDKEKEKKMGELGKEVGLSFFVFRRYILLHQYKSRYIFLENCETFEVAWQKYKWKAEQRWLFAAKKIEDYNDNYEEEEFVSYYADMGNGLGYMIEKISVGNGRYIEVRKSTKNLF